MRLACSRSCSPQRPEVAGELTSVSSVGAVSEDDRGVFTPAFILWKENALRVLLLRCEEPIGLLQLHQLTHLLKTKMKDVS